MARMPPLDPRRSIPAQSGTGQLRQPLFRSARYPSRHRHRDSTIHICKSSRSPLSFRDDLSLGSAVPPKIKIRWRHFAIALIVLSIQQALSISDRLKPSVQRRRYRRVRPRLKVLGRSGSIVLADDGPRDRAAGRPASRPIRVAIPPASVLPCLHHTALHMRSVEVAFARVPDCPCTNSLSEFVRRHAHLAWPIRASSADNCFDPERSCSITLCGVTYPVRVSAPIGAMQRRPRRYPPCRTTVQPAGPQR